ncbi:MAG TPA: serine/threonine-protein kinase [Myxococcota bacterium]|nr:serine/threonine-protein kinase [Myxococcota bacterium]
MTDFGNYQLDRLLGRGGMAEVFRARVKSGPRAGRAVALKRLLETMVHDPVCVDLFVSEADINRYLTHPNIVQMFEAGSVGEVFFIAMEYIEGRDLGQVVQACAQRKTHLRLDVACYIAHRVALALHFAHTAKNSEGVPLGIVHCDVTPSNIFISHQGDVKLGDFGVARTRAIGSALEGGLAGKPEYFAPEQILGEEASPATDVFALGVIFYELLTNMRPFQGKTLDELCDAIVEGKVPRPSTLRPVVPELEAVVLTALGRRASYEKTGVLHRVKSAIATKLPTRYNNAQEFADALHPFTGTATALAQVVRSLFNTAPTR